MQAFELVDRRWKTDMEDLITLLGRFIEPESAEHDTVPLPPPPRPAGVEPADSTSPSAPSIHERASEPSEQAVIRLRPPDGDAVTFDTLHQSVVPGMRERVLALIRNQSGIVDSYSMRVEGIPEGWWSVYPDTVYLVPFGSGGAYEQEVEIHLHPPRAPEAEARTWDAKVVADSRANHVVAAEAPLSLHIEPYVDTTTTLRPLRKRGRRQAIYDVTILNEGNAPVLAALEGDDPDGELRFGFSRPPQVLPADRGVALQMRVRPAKPIWVGLVQERQLEVKTITGEEVAMRAVTDPRDVEALEQRSTEKDDAGGRVEPQASGSYAPRTFLPQLYPAQPLRSRRLHEGSQPRHDDQAAPPPVRAIFVQRPWLPAWLLAVLLVLAVLASVTFPGLLPTVILPK